MARFQADGSLNDRLRQYRFRHTEKLSSMAIELVNLAGDVDRFLQCREAGYDAEEAYEVRNMQARLAALKGML